MTKDRSQEFMVKIQSLVDTHEEPFVVIDKNYCILSLNKAFEEAFHVNRKEVIKRICYEILHLEQTAFACNKQDELNCPYHSVFVLQKPCSCQHIHYDSLQRLVRVQIKAFPVISGSHKILLGMSVQKFSTEENTIGGEKTKLVGKSPVFTECVSQLLHAATTNMPILLNGETGTGKEVGALFIHNNSSRKGKPFITIDCTVLPENLFESELFGHEKGAFTGSIDSKKGLIELADGGTLFLDEISEMPLSMQSKLLRLIETGEFRRVGGTKFMKANARIICASNRDLLAQVESGQFRKDLYYRIAVFSIFMPPLQERLSDIPFIAEVILNQITDITSERYQLTNDALDLLLTYHYPGNIRELRNILQLAATYCHNGLITAKEIKRHIPFDKSQDVIKTNQLASANPASSYTKAIHERESQLISDILKQFNQKRRAVARAMGISERTLYRKMKRYNIK